MTPEQRLADVFVALAGGTADGPADIPTTLAVLVRSGSALLGAGAATAVFSASEGETTHVAGSDPEVARLERDAVALCEGPGHDCRSASGRRVRAVLDSGPARQRWPHYAPRALRLGHRRVAALPLREPTRSCGALVLLSDDPRCVLSEESLVLGQSLADFASAILRRAREADRSRALTAQLERALTSRVVVEQAKGILAVRWTVTVDEAFTRIRRHARAHQRPLHDVAREVVEGGAGADLTWE
ncbi:ANTAR domain-containing protein [Streptomyces niveiscabiei]|uniref:ANTAR domain-containing response regulator n=1 Tax=Streptomyces niveiscabiei TaxID=164115 RepID=UPI0029A53F5F|nr:ANTAR domain-containing protein [Streptomyces niveiscabiei]MDX3387225.1 ANTAR domain-containing protein [Streptomyces niveiscabiei]